MKFMKIMALITIVISIIALISSAFLIKSEPIIVIVMIWEFTTGTWALHYFLDVDKKDAKHNLNEKRKKA